MNKTLLTVGILAACIAAGPASAQGQQGQQDRSRDRTHEPDMDRVQDRDQMMDRDLSKDRDLARDQDRDRDRDMLSDKDRDQDRLRQQDRDRIYASELMTSQERTQYMNQLRSLRTEQERLQFRLEHQQTMQQRAKEQNAKLGAAPTRSQLGAQERERQQERVQIFGYELMDQTELDRYREHVRSAKTQEERERIQSTHQLEMQERARERGVALATDTN